MTMVLRYRSYTFYQWEMINGKELIAHPTKFWHLPASMLE